MLRLALLIACTNNQPVTSATPNSDNHMIHSAAVGFELLVNAAPNPAR